MNPGISCCGHSWASAGSLTEPSASSRVSWSEMCIRDSTRLASQVASEVRQHFAKETLTAAIPRSVRVSEAPSYGQSVLTYHSASAGAQAYFDAAAELARRGAGIDEMKERSA